jgi:Ca2+/Na+ antiporter
MKEKIVQIAHIVTGLVLFIQVNKWFDRENYTATTIYVVIASLFFIIAGTQKFIEKTFDNGNVPILLLEAVIMMFTAWHFKELKMYAVAFPFVPAALSYVAIAYWLVNSANTNPRKKRSKRKKRRSSSSVSQE